MEQRDTILQLIQKMTLALRVIFNLLPPEKFENIDTFNNFISSLTAHTSIDIDQLVAIKDIDCLQKHLQENLSLTSDNQELLADLLVQIGKKSIHLNTIRANEYYLCALRIYLLVDKTTQAYDWTRQQKILALKSRLKD